MQAVFLAFSAVFPLLVYMGLGYFLKTRRFFTGNTVQEMNKLVFNVLLPLSIFQSIYKCDLKSSLRWDVVVLVVAFNVGIFLLLSLLVPRFEKKQSDIPVLIQGIHKSNYNLLAVPIVSSFVGEDIGMTAVLVLFVTFLNNVFSAVTFETHRGGSTNFGKLLLKILKNPLVLSCIIGAAFNFIGVPLPDLLIDGVIGNLAALATPTALIALGATFAFSCVRQYAKQLTAVTVLKLIVVPGIVIPIAVLCGIRGADLLAVTVFAGAPNAVNSYSTAVSMGGNGELAGEIVIVTSIFSILSMFLGFCILGFWQVI